MSITTRIDSVLAGSWSTPLNSLRFLAVLSFLCVVTALLFPTTQRFLVGACVSFSGILALQLFRIKSVEEKPDSRDKEMTTLGLTNS